MAMSNNKRVMKNWGDGDGTAHPNIQTARLGQGWDP